MTGGNVLIAGGDLAQTVAEVFFTDFDNNPNADADGDGIAGIDHDTTGTVLSFRPVTSQMNTGRVAHTMTYVPGTPDRLVFVGGTGLGAALTGQPFTWNAADPVNNATFTGAGDILARVPMQAHTAALMTGTENVLVMRGHTVQIYFTK
jgi:hypothetical protein